MLPLKDRASWTPAQARGQFRQNFFPLLSTGGISAAFTQVSVHIVPSSAAEHLAEFCRMNHGPCPIVHQSKPGEVSTSPIAADCDIRTDLTAYGIFEHGVHTKTVTNILDIPFDDFVAFYLGCSHSFELALTDAGLPVRHQQVDRSVPSYKTTIPCISEGPFSGNVVASMRPMPRSLVQKAADVTAVLDQVHGAPLHIGDPCWIGVQDLLHPEYDDEPNINNGDVCMFWGCGTTAMEVLTNAKLPLMISLSPTATCCNFITDLSNEAFNKMHTPKSGSCQTRVVFICEQPVYGSLISDKAMELIKQLERLDKHDAIKPVIEVNGKPDEPVDSLVKAAMRLSHASSVAIVTLDDISSKEGFSVLSIIKSLEATQTKDVVVLVPEGKYPEWRNTISSCVDLKMLKKPISVSTFETCGGCSKEDILKILRPVLSTMDGIRPGGDRPCKFTALVGCDKEGGLWVESEAELMADIDAASTKFSKCTWPGEVLAGALYTLNCCPIHSRYLRKGLGQHKPLQQSEFMMTPKEEPVFGQPRSQSRLPGNGSGNEFSTLLSKLEVKFNTEEEEDLIKKTNMSTASTMKCLNIEA